MVSVHTPSWNRAGYLLRVWRGLLAQTFRDFEWIIADDGSTDGTAEEIERIRRESPFPVLSVTSSHRVGKATMDNAAVKIARGAFFVWNDSDDTLLPEALQMLVAAWESISPSDREGFVGISALCRTESELLTMNLPFEGVFDSTWNDLRFRYNVRGDMTFFCRSEILKAHPFPEVDFCVPEGAVWARIGARWKTRVLPEVVKIVEYHAPNAISFSKKMEYCRGKAHEMALASEYLKRYRISRGDRLWMRITYLRYCLHGEIGFRNALLLWKNDNALALFFVAPFSLLLALKDRLQGRVTATHRDFLKARAVASIAVHGAAGEAESKPGVAANPAPLTLSGAAT